MQLPVEFACGLQKLNTLNLCLFHPPLNPRNHFSTVLIKTNWYTISYKYQGCMNLTSITSEIINVFETGENAFLNCENAILYVPGGTKDLYQNMADWNRFSNIEEIINYIPLSLSCNNKGKVIINEGVQFTNDMGEVDVNYGVDNTFIFQPNENCQLEQVIIDGLDVTLSVKNNQLITKVHEGSKMIVTFSKSSGDMNGDGMVNISDVVALVNLILAQ